MLTNQKEIKHDMESDRAFLAAFRSGDIPIKDWSHRGHLRMAFVLICDMTPEDALPIARDGLKQLLDKAKAQGEPLRVGYHETITLAWLKIMAHAQTDLKREQANNPTFEKLLEACPDLFDKGLLLKHYSRELLESPLARESFIKPDIAPLP